MIEMIKLNGLMVRVSSFQRKIPSHPQVFEVVLLIPGFSGHRDIDHILNDQRIELTVYLEDGSEESCLVNVAHHEVMQIGPDSAPRTRHALMLRVEDEDAGFDRDEVLRGLDEVQAALDRLRELIEKAGFNSGQ